MSQREQFEPCRALTLTPLPAPALAADDEIAAHRATHARFFTMLRVGIPRETVEQAMRLAGVDPVELDGPHLVVDVAPVSATALLSRPRAAADAAAGSAPRARKKALRKRLYWEVKLRDVTTSYGIWSAPSRDSSSSSPTTATLSRETMALLEKLFVKEAIAPARASRGLASTKAARISILETKKAQNIGITLARVKLSLPQLIHELVDMNPTILCAAQLQGLLDMWPDRKELEAIDDFSGDPTLLGEAEQLFVGVKSIPRFREKLSCLIFKQEFPLRVHELRCVVGNLLNFGAESAHAAKVAGFSLGSLEKVAHTKAFVGGITLLQFVVQAVDRDCPRLADFDREINLIAKCSNVSIRSLFAEQSALEAGWKALVHEAHAGIAATADRDVCEPPGQARGPRAALMGSSILLHFAAEVENEVDAIRELLVQLEASKQRFLAHFDEQDATDELDVLLRHIARFTEEFVHQRNRLAETKQAVDRAVKAGARNAATTA
ncbi:hypothetical protein PybrP1_010072 [[Pythium] brassicae (nom. inval.)]|nr:hypothetical protein PybrP1_010072 [[Pythium] brassicae (nom. inval.)]